MQDRMAEIMAKHLFDNASLRKLFLCNVHGGVVPYYDLCVGSGGLRFMLRRLSEFISLQGGQVTFEELLMADDDSTSQSFIRNVDLANGNTTPMFGSIASLLDHDGSLAPEAYCFKTGQMRPVPRCGSNGVPPIIIAGIHCGLDSTENAHRHGRAGHIADGAGRASDALVSIGKLARAVGARMVLLENSPLVEGRTLEHSTWQDIQHVMVARAAMQGELVRLDGGKIVPQGRLRAYMRFADTDTGSRWQETMAGFMDAFGDEFKNIADYFMRGDEIAQCPFVHAYEHQSRVIKSFGEDMKQAAPDYESRGLEIPPVIEHTATYFLGDGFDDFVFKGTRGMCPRAQMVFHWGSKLHGCFSNVADDDVVVRNSTSR